MPGGFLKNPGTASCGMTGTFVAFARDCAASGDSMSESPPATVRAVKRETVKRFMYNSLRNRLLGGHNPNVESEIPGGCPGAELYLRRVGRSRTNPGSDALYANESISSARGST